MPHRSAWVERSRRKTGKSAKGSGWNLKLKVSRRSKVCETSPKRECWREREREERCPKKRLQTRSCTEDNFLSWLREDVEGKAEERENINREGRAEKVTDTLAVIVLLVWMRQFLRRVWTRKWWTCRGAVSVCVLVCVPFVSAVLACDYGVIWIFRRFPFLIVKLLIRRPFLFPQNVTSSLRLGCDAKDEYRRDVRQRCARSGQGQAHAAKSGFQSSTRTGTEQSIASTNMACTGKRSASGGGQDASGRREPFMECV